MTVQFEIDHEAEKAEYVNAFWKEELDEEDEIDEWSQKLLEVLDETDFLSHYFVEGFSDAKKAIESIVIAEQRENNELHEAVIDEILKGDNMIKDLALELNPAILTGWESECGKRWVMPDFLTKERVISLIANELLRRYPAMGENICDPMEWDDTDTVYKKQNLMSSAHKRICVELEKRDIMFVFEAQTILPGDKKTYRRIDLIIFHNNRALILEIDGASHRGQKQQQDDYERDRLIGNHCNNALRLEYGFVKEDFRFNGGNVVMERILSRLDGDAGLIRK